MGEIKRINESLSVAGQITPKQLQTAAQEGVKSVLNLRSPAEQGFLPDEQQQAESLGLSYVSAPLKVDELTEAQLGQIVAELEKLPKPAIVHCAGGLRASAVALLSVLTKDGVTPEDALNRAKQLGFDYDANPRLKQLFEQFIANHTPSKSLG